MFSYSSHCRLPPSTPAKKHKLPLLVSTISSKNRPTQDSLSNFLFYLLNSVSEKKIMLRLCHRNRRYLRLPLPYLACSPLLNHLLKTPSSRQTIAKIPNISLPPPLFFVAPYSLSLPLSSPPYSHPSLIIIHNPQTPTLTATMITILCTLHLRRKFQNQMNLLKESFIT